MENELSSALQRVGITVLLIGIVFLICKIRKFPIADTLALRKPSSKHVFLWLGLFAVLVLIEESLLRVFGMDSQETWMFSLPVIVIRASGIILFAPIGEELLFRGLLFKRISDTGLGVPGAILIPAIGFSLIHIQYDPSTLVFILVDGIFYGMARHFSGSVYIPIILHGLGNLYAVIERLPT